MNRLRMGVIGAGLWGGNHAHTFNVLPETELVGVCDLDEGRALKMKETYGATQAFTDYQQLISSDQIDAISVATPDFTHTPIILAALKADKHVLSEKPLATTVREAEEIAAAAAKSKGKLMIDFH